MSDPQPIARLLDEAELWEFEDALAAWDDVTGSDAELPAPPTEAE